jgi:hypothetical protein
MLEKMLRKRTDFRALISMNVGSDAQEKNRFLCPYFYGCWRRCSELAKDLTLEILVFAQAKNRITVPIFPWMVEKMLRIVKRSNP